MHCEHGNLFATWDLLLVHRPAVPFIHCCDNNSVVHGVCFMWQVVLFIDGKQESGICQDEDQDVGPNINIFGPTYISSYILYEKVNV